MVWCVHVPATHLLSPILPCPGCHACRYSNLLLTTHSDTILACAYQVGGAMSSLRQLQAGKPYAFPPVTHGIPPDSCTTLGEWQTTVAQAAALVADSHQHSSNHASNGRGKGAKPKAGSKGVSWCSSTSNGAPLFIEGVTRAFTGVSPALVRDMCEAAGEQGHIVCAQVVCVPESMMSFFMRG